MKDHQGSTRSAFDDNRGQSASIEYTPYGESYYSSGMADITRRFTGYTWDSLSNLYYTVFRYYSDFSSRWLARDPAGMIDGPNVYSYVSGNPIVNYDRIGLNKCNAQLKACVSSARTWRDGEIRRINSTWTACQAAVFVACFNTCAWACFATGGFACVTCAAICKAAQIAFCNLSRSNALKGVQEQFGVKLDKCRADFDSCRSGCP